jgi:hypothetical protein
MRAMKRRLPGFASHVARVAIWGAVLVMGAVHLGCISRALRCGADGEPLPVYDPDSVQLVSDLTRPWGMKPLPVEGVSLVVGLRGTGGDAPPSAERSLLMAEMQTRNIDRPNELLAGKNTSLVVVRGLIPPGAQKGDHFDLEVTVPRRSETTSLAGGWLLPTRLTEYAVIGSRVAGGHLMAMAQGDVLIEALVAGGQDAVDQLRGRVLGGGVVARSRSLGLLVRDEFASVKTSARIGEALNYRFHVYDNGLQRGVADPKRDNFIELRIHPRYQGNVTRYIRVIQNVAVRESAGDLAARMEVMRSRLMHPPTSAQAALQLEAIGEPGRPILHDGLTAPELEVRFYAAEALAYLDDPEAAPVLAEVIRREPAFRWRAIEALAAMEEIAAHEELVNLLHVDSAETRYGAFRVLQRLSPDDPMVAGEVLNERFHFHIVSSTGPPLVHMARDDRPEIVLFGGDHPLRLPVVAFAGGEIVARSHDDGQLVVSRLSTDDEDQHLSIPPSLEKLIRAIVELGGSYPDVVQAIVELKRSGGLASRLEFSAVPELNRVYHRSEDSDLSSLDANREEATP